MDRPGHYTVRLSLVFYHNDERRADGIKLDLSDLMEVSLFKIRTKNCGVYSGHICVYIEEPINRVPAKNRHTSIKR